MPISIYRKPRFQLLPGLIARASTHPIEFLSELGCPESFAKLAAVIRVESEMSLLAGEMDVLLFRLVNAVPPEKRSETLNLKRHFKKGFEPLDAGREASARALGEAKLAALIDNWQSMSHKRSGLLHEARKAFEVGCADARQRLRKNLEDPLVREGLFLSSESLYEAALRYLKKDRKESDASKSERQLERSLVEHLARACAKTTPRGVLTGVGMAKIREDGARTDNAVGADPIHRRKTLLTLPVARALAELISGADSLWRHVVPRPNPTWYKSEGKIYFWKTVLGSTEESESLMALPEQDLIVYFLEEAKSREFAAAALVDRVHDLTEGDYSTEDLTEFYQKLCSKGVLIGDLEIPFEALDGLNFVIEWLRHVEASAGAHASEIEEARKFRIRLSEVSSILGEIDDPALSWTDRLSRYRQLREKLVSFWPDQNESLKQIPVNDMIAPECEALPGIVGLAGDLSGDLARALEICHRLTAASGASFDPVRMTASTLKDLDLPFGADIPLWMLFEERAEKPRENKGESKSAPADVPSGRLAHQEFVRLFEGWLESQTADRESVRVLDLKEDGFLAKIEASPNRLNMGAGKVEFQIASSGLDSLNAGDYQVVIESMPNNLSIGLTRHLQTLDYPELRSQFREHAAWLKDRMFQGQTWADVLVMTGSKTDTAFWHDRFSEFAIESFRTRSAGKGDQVVPINELFLRFNDDRSEVTVIWKRKGGEVPIHPYFVSLIASGITPPMVAFFRNIGSSIGPALNYWIKPSFFDRSHLPRLVVGKIVLQRETWTFQRKDLVSNLSSDSWESFERWGRWRQANELPRHVFVYGESRPYWVDLESPYSLEILASSIRSNPDGIIRIKEMLPTPEQIWRRNEKGSYATQWVACFQWETPE